MDYISNRNISNSLLDEAYRCKHVELKSLLGKIESEINDRGYADRILLRAKMIVTSKMALMNSK
ncbi:MAG: hypothetical protein QMD61_01355 [Methanobacterium sp.]|nr:hypothetical protein [Methanobacterium sp.]